MPSTVVSHYRLLNPLGTGGMGVVYLAEDTTLGRTVALKFLAPQIAHDPRRVDRFRDEARTASSLNHPNICTIYEVGEEDGELFIAMEYVEGRPLSEFLRENGMPAETVLRYARQIAGALEHAHSRGIIHRDLKPVNVVITPAGDAKILDFGLAKRTDPDEVQRKTMGGGPTETSAGLTGTLPYMSPEQLEGNEAGTRSDIWALGVVLYEMTSGVRPFRGENLYRLCTAILQEPAPPLPEHVPAGLVGVIKRCLEKEPDRRYQRVSELRAALEAIDLSAPTATTPVPREKSRAFMWSALALAVALAVLVSVQVLRTVRSHMAAAGMAIPVPERVQLAVLPPSGGVLPEEAAFDNGLVETLTSRLTQLSKTHPLAVIPASEVRARKVTSVDEARAEFGVNIGLLVHIQHASGQERVNYSLVDARTHQELRAGTITAATNDPFALQDQVSESVAQALEMELRPQEKKALAVHGTSEPAAYDFYLQGRGYLQNYDKEENIENAISVFRSALQKDSGFASAYAGLGEAYWRKFESTHNKDLPGEATRACETAVEKDAGLAEAHMCLGFVYIGTGKYEQGVTEYQKAVRSEPTLDAAQAGLAHAYESLNRPDEAERAYKAAIALQPNYWAGYNRLAVFYFQHGRMDEAAKMFSQVVSLVPDSFAGYSNWGAVRLAQGQYAEAVPLFEKSVAIRKRADNTSNLGTAYFQLRRYADAARAYEEAVQLDDKSYVVWGNLGDACYWTPGRRSDAAPAYRKAIALAEDTLRVNERDPDAWSSVAVYHAMLGERSSALDALQRALGLEPKRSDLLLNAAITEGQVGDRKRALGYLQRAVAAGLPAASVKDLPNFDGERNDPGFQKLFAGK